MINRTSKSIVNKIKAFWWKHIHLQEWSEMVQKGIAKAPGVSIIKTSKQESSQLQVSRQGSALSKSSDKTKKTVIRAEGDNSKESGDENNPLNSTKNPQTQKIAEEKTNKMYKIKFEDEAFKTERFEKMLDANLFMGYLIDFFEENEDIMLVVNDDNNKGKHL